MSSASSSVTEEIKSKLDIVQLISEYIQVKKAGTRFVASCPFHSEKTPSFSISPDNQFWYCFGCGEGGDAFGFVMRMEGLDFVGAKRLLAQKAGVELRHEDAQEYGEKQRLVEINRWAAKFFHEVLLRSPKAEQARAYVARRGMRAETVDEFMIGYAPASWDATSAFLRKKGFKDQDMFAAGLLIKKERGGYFDRFRGRLMFPIADFSGAIVGFTGRIMPGADGKDPANEAKYVNSPQTAIYDKSQILYGFDKAKQEIRKKGFAVVVEGNMDVVASHQAGVRNVVASSGTAFTPEQMRRLSTLKRLAGKLILSFDGDKAGENAIRRSIDAAVAAEFSVRVLRLPPGAGKDPDDCIRKDPALWTQAIADAMPYMEWYMQLIKERTDLKNPDVVREASLALRKEIAKIPDSVERSFWIRQASIFFQVPESVLFEDVQRMMKGGVAAPVAAGVVAKPAKQHNRTVMVSEHVLGAMLAWPESAESLIATIRPEFFEETLQGLYRSFVVFYNNHRSGDANTGAFRRFCEAEGNNHDPAQIAVLELQAQKEFGDVTPEGRREALVRLTSELKQLFIVRRQRELTATMARAEKAGDGTAIKDIQQQLNELIVS